MQPSVFFFFRKIVRNWTFVWYQKVCFFFLDNKNLFIERKCKRYSCHLRYACSQIMLCTLVSSVSLMIILLNLKYNFFCFFLYKRRIKYIIESRMDLVLFYLEVKIHHRTSDRVFTLFYFNKKLTFAVQFLIIIFATIFKLVLFFALDVRANILHTRVWHFKKRA